MVRLRSGIWTPHAPVGKNSRCFEGMIDGNYGLGDTNAASPRPKRCRAIIIVVSINFDELRWNNEVRMASLLFPRNLFRQTLFHYRGRKKRVCFSSNMRVILAQGPC